MGKKEKAKERGRERERAKGREKQRFKKDQKNKNDEKTRKGAKKVLTDRPLTYSQPMATSHWFDTAKAAHGEYWISEVKRRAGGG